MKTFKEFYILWYARAKAFAREYVISEMDAEDIVQDVFLELFVRYEDDFAGINIVAILFISLKNKCIDHLRRKIIKTDMFDRIQEEYNLTLKMKFDSLEILDDGLFDEDDVIGIITKAIETLPPRCREIFVKHKIEGMKQKDIAVQLGISVKTVENHIQNAYQRLRHILKIYFGIIIFLL